MQPHKKIKDLLIMVSLCEPPDNTVWHLRARYILTGAVILNIILAMGVSAGTPIIIAEDLKSLLNAVCDTFGIIAFLLILAIGFLYRGELNELFSKLNQNYEKCNRNMYTLNLYYFVRFLHLFFFLSFYSSQGRRLC